MLTLLSLCLNFCQKSGWVGMLLNVFLVKKHVLARNWKLEDVKSKQISVK